MKTLLLDIETAPHVAYCWGLFDQHIALNQIIATGYTLCFSAKWLGSDEVIFEAVWKGGRKKMLKKAHSLLNEADAIITYNGKKFDVPTLNKEFLKDGMLPPAPYKHIDLYQVSKSTFRFASNKLDHITRELGQEGKFDHRGHALWTGCMNGDPECHAEMETYNRKDVTELEGVYMHYRPWIRAHPNHGLYDEPGVPVCTNCGSGHLQRRGYARTAVNKYERYQCAECGTWVRGATTELPKEDRQLIMRRDLG